MGAVLVLVSLALACFSLASCDKYPWEDDEEYDLDRLDWDNDGRPDSVEDKSVRKSDDSGSEDSVGRVLKGEMKGVFKYTDKDGVVNYVDSIKKVPKQYRKRVSHPKDGVVNIFPSTDIDEVADKLHVDRNKYKRTAKAKTRRHGQVILYTTPWCGYCTKARRYLTRKGVAFKEKRVDKSRANLQEMLEKSGGARGVPVIDVNGTIIRGFSARAVDQALAK